MSVPILTRRRSLWGLVALLFVGMLLQLVAIRGQSLTNDDPYHVLRSHRHRPAQELWRLLKPFALRGELHSTLEDWVLLGLKLGHPLPVLAKIDLNRAPVFEPLEAV